MPKLLYEEELPPVKTSKPGGKRIRETGPSDPEHLQVKLPTKEKVKPSKGEMVTRARNNIRTQLITHSPIVEDENINKNRISEYAAWILESFTQSYPDVDMEKDFEVSNGAITHKVSGVFLPTENGKDNIDDKNQLFLKLEDHIKDWNKVLKEEKELNPDKVKEIIMEMVSENEKN